MNTLMIIAADRISEWINKGEVTERYYNPGNLFSEIHLVMLNEDHPCPEALQKLVGSAKVYLHHFPTGIPFFVKTFAWNPMLLSIWARNIIALAEKVKPELIRCHVAGLNSFVAMKIHEKLGIPYVVSLHINPDINVRVPGRNIVRRIRDHASEHLEILSLRAATMVLPVYKPIVPYLERIGVKRYKVAYNALNPTHFQRKTEYTLHSPIKVISVGRQFTEKNPDNLIRAIAKMKNVDLTLVGNGTHHQRLKDLAIELCVQDRTRFFPSIPNDDLCRMLPSFDIFATHTEYWELSKSVLEPLITGLPVLLNRRKGEPVPELTEDICAFVDNTVEGYQEGLEKLISSETLRRKLGNQAFEHAKANWHPERTEAVFVETYRKILKKN